MSLTEKERKVLERLYEDAARYAPVLCWEPCGEKSYCFVVGAAMTEDEKHVAGRLPEGEFTYEEFLFVGENHSQHGSTFAPLFAEMFNALPALLAAAKALAAATGDAEELANEIVEISGPYSVREEAYVPILRAALAKANLRGFTDGCAKEAELRAENERLREELRIAESTQRVPIEAKSEGIVALIRTQARRINHMAFQFPASYAKEVIDEYVEQVTSAAESRAEEMEAENRHLRDVEGAARKVPIVDVDLEPDGVRPWLTCKGCGSTDSEGCESGCWVLNLDVALGSMSEYDAARTDALLERGKEESGE